MPTDKLALHNAFIATLTEEAANRRNTIDACKTVDELFEKTLTDRSKLTEAELADYNHYREKYAEFAPKFQKFSRQFVWGVEEVKWPTDEATRKKWTDQRSFHQQEMYEDYFKENRKDEQFVRGATLARYLDPDNTVLKRAAFLVRQKQQEYDKTSAVGRFFSYLNPFSNKYRTMRNEIAQLKEKVAATTGCDKAELNDYVAGKRTAVATEAGGLCSFERINDFLESADYTRTIGDPFEEIDELEEETDLDRVNQPAAETDVPEIDQNAAEDELGQNLAN